MISYTEPFCAHKIITYNGTLRASVTVTCKNCGAKYCYRRLDKDAHREGTKTDSTSSLCLKCR